MRRLLRIFKIIRVFAKYRLDTFLTSLNLRWYIRLLLMLMIWRYVIPVGKRSQGERLRLALEELGPIFIKFGQMLSTRRDLLPEDLVDELAKLQDEVAPSSQEVVLLSK